MELPSGEFVDQLSAGPILSAASEYKVTCWEIEDSPEKVLPDDSEIKAVKAELVSFKRAVKREFKTKKKLYRRYYALESRCEGFALRRWHCVCSIFGT